MRKQTEVVGKVQNLGALQSVFSKNCVMQNRKEGKMRMKKLASCRELVHLQSAALQMAKCHEIDHNSICVNVGTDSMTMIPVHMLIFEFLRNSKCRT